MKKNSTLKTILICLAVTALVAAVVYFVVRYIKDTKEDDFDDDDFDYLDLDEDADHTVPIEDSSSETKEQPVPEEKPQEASAAPDSGTAAEA